MVWLNKSSPPEMVEEAVKMDAAIEAANERMVYVTGDKEDIRAYWRYQMALSDHTSEMNYARDEGLRQGIEQGIKHGLETTAINAFAKGFTFDAIHEITGLDIEFIKKLMDDSAAQI